MIGNLFGSIFGSGLVIDQRKQLPGETDEQYERRMRQLNNSVRSRGPNRTVAQDKRDARKARNRAKARRA